MIRSKKKRPNSRIKLVLLCLFTLCSCMFCFLDFSAIGLWYCYGRNKAKYNLLNPCFAHAHLSFQINHSIICFFFSFYLNFPHGIHMLICSCSKIIQKINLRLHRKYMTILFTISFPFCFFTSECVTEKRGFQTFESREVVHFLGFHFNASRPIM